MSPKVTLRQLPGATVFGLIAALVAHAVVFGGEHAWGGAYHSALLQFTLAAVTALTAAAGALLWSGARCAADGTVLAARMRPMLPAWEAIALSGLGWFALGECVETAHAGVPFLAVVAILALTAWVVRWFASAALRVLARIVFSIAVAIVASCHPELGRSLCASMRGPTLARSCRVVEGRGPRPPPVIANA